MSAHVLVPSPIFLKTYEDHTVLYHSGTGDTHLLTTDAVTILALLNSDAKAIHTLIAEVAESLNYQMSDDFSDHIRALLFDMKALDIVEFI